MKNFKPIKISKPAQNDIKNIGNYTLEQWEKLQKRTYLNLFKQSFIVLSKKDIDADCLPLIKNRADIDKGLMSYFVKNHVIYYRETKHELVIVRILHTRMEPSKHLR